MIKQLLNVTCLIAFSLILAACSKSSGGSTLPPGERVTPNSSPLAQALADHHWCDADTFPNENGIDVYTRTLMSSDGSFTGYEIQDSNGKVLSTHLGTWKATQSELTMTLKSGESLTSTLEMSEDQTYVVETYTAEGQTYTNLLEKCD